AGLLPASTGRGDYNLPPWPLFGPTALLNELRHQRGPTALVAGAEPGAVVAVEIFIEQYIIAPVWVRLKALSAAVDGPAPVVVLQKDADEPARQVGGHLVKVHELARAARALHPVIGAVIVMVLLQRLDHEEVGGEPDRAAPVGVAAENASG